MSRFPDVASASLLFLAPSGRTHLLYLPNTEFPGAIDAWFAAMTPEDRTLLVPALEKVIDHVAGSRR